MKKLIIATISVFVLVNFAFAQSAQQKVDSLKREKAKAEQAKKLADDKLRQSQTEQNYQAAKAAREKMEKVNKELESALNAQKAEEEAKAKAKAEAEAKAKAKAKTEEQARVEALYQKKFPEFERAGVYDYLKQYIFEELKKDPNWDIIDIYRSSYKKADKKYYNEEEDYYFYTHVTVPVLIIKSTSNTEGKSFDGSYGRQQSWDEILKAWQWHKNPEAFYYFVQGNSKILNAYKNYYYGYTGKKLTSKELSDLKQCTSIKLYELYMLNGEIHYYKLHKNGPYKLQFDDGYVRTETRIHIEEISPQIFFYSVCNNDLKNIPTIYSGHLMHTRDRKYTGDYTIEEFIKKKNLKVVPPRNVKTFKIEDYMK